MARIFARFKCRIPAEVITAKGATACDVLNVGAGGALVCLRGKLEEGQKARLRVRIEGETLDVDSRVLREHGPDPKDSRSTFWGIGFLQSGQKTAALLVDRVRQRQSTPDDYPLKDYW